jgi:hypothetical protein
LQAVMIQAAESEVTLWPVSWAASVALEWAGGAGR